MKPFGRGQCRWAGAAGGKLTPLGIGWETFYVESNRCRFEGSVSDSGGRYGFIRKLSGSRQRPAAPRAQRHPHQGVRLRPTGPGRCCN